MNITEFVRINREIAPKFQWIKTDPGMGVVNALIESAAYDEECMLILLEQMLHSEIRNALERIEKFPKRQLVVLDFGRLALQNSMEPEDDQKLFNEILDRIFNLSDNTRVALVFNYGWNRSLRIKYDPAYLPRFCLAEIE